MGKKKKESKVVGVQEDGTEVYGFDSEPSEVVEVSEAPIEEQKAERVLPVGAIKNHAKFHKFKKGNE